MKHYEIASFPSTEDFRPSCRLMDYTKLAPYIWREGIRVAASETFVPGMLPSLLKRDEVVDWNSDDGLMLGIRPAGSLELLDWSHLELPKSFKNLDENTEPIKNDQDWWKVSKTTPTKISVRKKIHNIVTNISSSSTSDSSLMKARTNSIQAKQAERQRIQATNRQQQEVNPSSPPGFWQQVKN